jgi:MGT family glycosyltransferase
MLPGVRAAALDFQPDVMVVDQQAIAGGIVARSLGVPWATSSPTALMHSNLLDDYPKVQEWILGLFNDLQVRAGVDPVERPDVSPQLVLLYTTQSLIDVGTVLPEHTLLLGPVLEGRVENVEAFPWERLQDRPRVLVSLGTVNTYLGRTFYQHVIDAFKDEPVQVILKAPMEMLKAPVPDNFIVEDWLPQLELLKHVDAVISHAGSTVSESIMAGRPVVVVPVAYDNFIFADLAVKAGVAVRLRFGRSTASDLAAAVHEVLDDPQYREAALRIRDEFLAAGGTARGAEALEQLVASRVTGDPA